MNQPAGESRASPHTFQGYDRTSEGSSNLEKITSNLFYNYV
jgi:hypothetical protein